MELLVQQGADVNILDNDNNSPLHMVAMRDFMSAEQLTQEEEDKAVAMVRVLLEKGANPNAQNKLLNTPMHLMASGFGSECVRLLIEAGGDVNARDKVATVCQLSGVSHLPESEPLQSPASVVQKRRGCAPTHRKGSRRGRQSDGMDCSTTAVGLTGVYYRMARHRCTCLQGPTPRRSFAPS